MFSNDKSEKDKKLSRVTNVKALSGTVIFYVLLIALFINLGMTIKLPLPGGDEGIEVMLGQGDVGQDNFQEAVEQTIQLNENIPVSQEKVDVNETSKTENSEVITQNTEEAPVISEKKEEKKQEKVVEERRPNPLFEYSKSNKGTFGKGNNNISGDQGNPNGTPNSTNPFGTGKGQKGDGTGVSGNNGQGDFGTGTGLSTSGFSFSLKGRKLVDRPIINDESQQEGKIIIEITVDRRGRVIRAEVTRGSTTTAGPLVETAKPAAMKVSFSPDPDAPEEQYGTITFNFKLK
jgi:periplasmic protein TonB